MVAILSVALVGCGGDDLGGDGAGDSGSGATGDFCRTAHDLADELAGFEDDFGSEDFYSDIIDLYRRLGAAASGDLADDFDRAVAGFEKIAEWSEDPSSDYPFTDAEDAELEAGMNRIEAAADACGIDVDGDDDDDGDGDDSTDGFDIDVDELDDDGTTLTFGDGEESGEVAFGGDLPDDFPFPVPVNFQVGSSFKFDDANGTSFSAVLNTPEADFDAVLTLYETFLNAEGFDVEKTDVSSGDTKFVFLSGERSDARADFTMSTAEVANDAAGNLTFETLVSMTWTPIG